MSISLNGLLRNYEGKKINIFQDVNGKQLSDKKARAKIAELLELGHKLMPLNANCEGFDPFGGGCPGHQIDDHVEDEKA